MIRRQIQPAISLTLVLMIITGLMYPMAVTALAQLLFPHQANGSIVMRGGHPVGSALIGQQFLDPRYFHPRPSAAGRGYDPLSSGGTNKGPTDRKLADTVIAEAIDSVVAQDGAQRGQIPADLVTSSGSGLDPDISPASAAVQVARIARTRHIDSTAIAAVIARHITTRQVWILGEPRVNVLSLNLALDSMLTLSSRATR